MFNFSGYFILVADQSLSNDITLLMYTCQFTIHIPPYTHTQSTKAVYNRIIDLKIATPQIIINYGLFLEEQNYFEEAFKVSH